MSRYFNFLNGMPIQQLEVFPMFKRLLAIVFLSIASLNASAQLTEPSSPPSVSLFTSEENGPLTAPATIVLTANAQAFDTTLFSISFYAGDTLIATVYKGQNTISWTNVPSGEYILTAVAIDGLGRWTRSEPLYLSVGSNAAPTVTMVAAPTETSAPGTITLSANASDSDGSITKVEFFNGTTLLATKTQAPYSYVWSNVAAGSYSIVARATDDRGKATTTQPSVVTVAGVTTPQVYYVYADQVNTAREITNAAGALVWRADTAEPFGANFPYENPSSLGNFVYNQRFPGQYFDKETGLHYNYFRDYDPALGRYIQSDPIGLRGGINTYLYVMGNPLRGFDPYGLADASTIMCDGNGNYVVVNNDKGPASGCTQIHEQSHIQDWVDRYGKNSCVGKPAGYLPTASVNGDNYRDFLRDSECRAFEAEKSCVQKCNDPVETKRWQRGFEKNYCESYSSWKKR